MTETDSLTLSSSVNADAAMPTRPLTTSLVATIAAMSATLMPLSPFGLLLAVYWSRRTIGWEYRVTMAAALICAISSLVFAVIVLGTCVNLLAGQF